MHRIRIAGTGSYLPEQILTNEELEQRVDTSDAWIRQRTGIRERRIRASHQASSDLATEAGRAALEAAGADPDEVDLVICATVTPDHAMPSTACLVQRNLGLEGIAAFDLALACSSFVAALQVASQYIRTGASRGVLVIGVDCSSTIMDYQDRGTCVIFGDGAGACFLRAAREDEESDLLYQSLRVKGDDEVMVVPAGGSRQPASQETVENRLHYFKMDGKRTFRFAVKIFRRLLEEGAEASGISLEEVALVVPHQVNLRIIKSAVEKLEVALAERVMMNLERYGNTISASVPIALDEAAREGRIKRGQVVALIAFGAGLSWGSCFLRW